ncbi:MAG: phosphotransferase enzyme family protein [bacterium]
MFGNHILSQYFSDAASHHIDLFGNGLIHKTYTVSTGSSPEYILQEVNTSVFKTPLNIASNLEALSNFLEQNGREVFYPTPLPTITGEPYAIESGSFFRLTPFVKGTYTVDACSTAEQAYEAALQFGKFTAAFKGMDVSILKPTIPRFHDLSFRWEQFTEAMQNGNKDRIQLAAKVIEQIQNDFKIVTRYQSIVSSSQFLQRVTHHDTKINNVLLNGEGKGVCVIDLDTVMSGLLISDLGDMFRTYLSPGNEEGTDLSQVYVRPDFHKAIIAGYLEHMKDQLNKEELDAVNYAGEFMIYMQALRFLTDFLNDDTYYGIKYPMNNYDRTVNQMALLDHYKAVTA